MEDEIDTLSWMPCTSDASEANGDVDGGMLRIDGITDTYELLEESVVGNLKDGGTGEIRNQ